MRTFIEDLCVWKYTRCNRRPGQWRGRPIHRWNNLCSLATFLVVLLGVFSLSGCSGLANVNTSSSNGKASAANAASAGATSNTATLNGTAEAGLAISVFPTSTTVAVGATQQTTAMVTGNPNTSVTWGVSGAGCSGAACGTISSDGLYTAPSSVPSPATVSVIATSVADPTKSASASVTVVAAVAVLLSISPTSASVPTAGMQSFTATVNSASNTAVAWSLTGAGCSGSACGTLSTSALSAVYSAPFVAPSPASVTVVATNVEDPTKSAAATLTIVPTVLISVTPINVSVLPGTTQQFNAAVTGMSNTAVAWVVSGAGCSGAACGIIDSSGSYTAPSAAPSQPTVTVTATSIADPTKSGSVNVNLDAAASVTVTVQPNGSTTSPYSPLRPLPGATKRLYANVCKGSNAPDCARPADISVTWQTSCGALSATTGPYVYYTAPSSGGPCIISATNPPSGVSATATATLANPSVSIDVIPAALVLYKGQYVLLQAIVSGSVNRDVTWSLTDNSGGAGTLTPQGWTATFSASAAGTYVATATSSADGTKTAVVTLYVTANAMPATATANHTEPVDCTATGSGTTYEVGPARAYTTISAVPWYRLVAGDTVRIHNDGSAGSPTTYHEKWNIRKSGTASQPIRVCGVASNNELPVISGDLAATSASFDYGGLENYAGILIYDHTVGFGNYGSATYPKYITVEGLKITHIGPAFNYVPQAGGSLAWPDYASGVWVQHGAHVILRGLDIEDTDQGVFSNAQNSLGENTMSRNFLIQGNYFANNGDATGRHHQTYAQSFGQVIQGNYYDDPRVATPGVDIKTRCTECFIRYNYLTAINGGGHVLDIMAPEESATFVMAQEWYRAGETAIGINDVAAAEDWYGTHYVYGNIIKFTNPPRPFHYTDDNCPEDAPGGTLYFYHNTVWEAGTTQYRWYMFSQTPQGAPCNADDPVTRYSGVRQTNNAIKLSPASITNPYFFWEESSGGFVTLDVNWISASWGTGIGQGNLGDGTAYDLGFTGLYQTGNDAHHITGIGSLITGSGTPFDMSTYVPIGGGPLVGTSGPLPAVVSSALPVTMQYSPATYLMSPRPSAKDLGAVSH